MNNFDRIDPLRGLISPMTVSIPRISDSSLNPAKWMHERIVSSINDFEKNLDQEYEVGARLVTFGADFTFYIEDVGYWGPDIIIFYGVDKNNKKVELLQHITQLSVLLIAVDKMQEQPRRIGFALMKDIEKGKA